MDKLSNEEILQAGLDDWRKLATRLHARFETGDFVSGLAFVTAITDAAEAMNHHPDVLLTYPRVDITLLSHDVGMLTDRDLRLARKISEIAAERGIKALPREVATLELALDTADHAAIGPFWAALLTGSTTSLHGSDVVDPSGRVPLLWFQDTDAHETPRQRFHLDLWLPPDVAEERIAAAVAAGGAVVDDSQAPSFTVLADSEGNRACICTMLER
jgi:4a-hydroxytetrahydrobiopterin dehydratase